MLEEAKEMTQELPTYFMVLMWTIVFLFASFRIIHVELGFNWTEWKFQIQMLWAGNKPLSIIRMWMYLVVLHTILLPIISYINYTKFFP